MEKEVTLNGLISTGSTIREGITFVEPPSNVIRFFSVYKLADNTEYSDWKALVMMYLKQHHSDTYSQVNELFLKLFKENLLK